MPPRTVISGRLAVYSCRSVADCDQHVRHLTRRLAVPADHHLRDDIWADLDRLLELRMRLALAEEGKT